jgi:hypothetical protein
MPVIRRMPVIRSEDAQPPGLIPGQDARSPATGAPLWLTSQIEELGAVTIPEGELVLLDFGLLRLWAAEPGPATDLGDPSDQAAADAEATVDLRITGDDPVAAGQATGLFAVTGRYVFDVSASKVDEMRDAVVSAAGRRGFTVQVEPIPRMPHRTRVARLLDDSPDGAEVRYGGPWAVAVRGLPSDRPLRVRGARMPADDPYCARWHSIWVETDEQAPARTEDVGHVAVDEARLVFAAPDALTAWRTDIAVDGLADLAFWGRDAGMLAERLGAGALDDDTCGWTDLPVRDAVQRARDFHRIRESEDLRFAFDFRPHDDHHRLLSAARTAPTESASAEIGGYVVCGFFTSWGDGVFPVRRDLAADGTLCRLRVEVGAPEVVELQRQMEDRWFGELSRAALVSAQVARHGAPVGWMYREAADHPGDSGWRIFAGDETGDELDDPGNIAVMPLRDLVAKEAALEPFVRRPAPAAFERGADGGFIPAEPPPPSG